MEADGARQRPAVVFRGWTSLLSEAFGGCARRLVVMERELRSVGKTVGAKDLNSGAREAEPVVLVRAWTFG